jgi:acyl-CoA-binding protein
LELTPGALDVQVSRETRQLRVRDLKGRPLAGAYVKVYVRDASGSETKFHKDGYTDLRGAFDYEAVSTDTDFRPAEFAVFVQGADGVRTLTVRR